MSDRYNNQLHHINTYMQELYSFKLEPLYFLNSIALYRCTRRYSGIGVPIAEYLSIFKKRPHLIDTTIVFAPLDELEKLSLARSRRTTARWTSH